MKKSVIRVKIFSLNQSKNKSCNNEEMLTYDSVA